MAVHNYPQSAFNLNTIVTNKTFILWCISAVNAYQVCANQQDCVKNIVLIIARGKIIMLIAYVIICGNAK